MPPPTYSYQSYQAACFCPTPTDLAQMTAVLDQRHNDLPKRPNDPNAYVFGSIGDLNVVLYCLPLGANSDRVTASLTIRMLTTFPRIDFVLVVGVAGGVPRRVQLGDVVVSSSLTPCTFSSDSSWILGRVSNYFFVPLLCTYAKFLAAARPNTPANKYLPPLTVTRPDVVGRGYFVYPVDVEFHPDTLHSHENEIPFTTGNIPRPCYHCDKTGATIRQPREIHVHNGSIVTSSRQMAAGHTRDIVIRTLGRGFLAFDTNSLGVMDNIPALVIRGISCYADEHSGDFNAVWAEYAAAAAAAVAKQILYEGQAREFIKLPLPGANDLSVGLLPDSTPLDRAHRRNTARDLAMVSPSGSVSPGPGGSAPLWSGGGRGEGACRRSSANNPESSRNIKVPPVAGTSDGLKDTLDTRTLHQETLPSGLEVSKQRQKHTKATELDRIGNRTIRVGTRAPENKPSPLPKASRQNPPSQDPQGSRAPENKTSPLPKASQQNSPSQEPQGLQGQSLIALKILRTNPSPSKTTIPEQVSTSGNSFVPCIYVPTSPLRSTASGQTTVTRPFRLSFDDEVGAMSFVPVDSNINPSKDPDWIEIGHHMVHPYDSHYHQRLFNRMEPETVKWFCKSKQVQTWFKNRSRTLFCPGAPGTGKSVLASMIVESFGTCNKDPSGTAVACLYDIHQYPAEKATCYHLLAAILAQLALTAYGNQTGPPTSHVPASLFISKRDIQDYLEFCIMKFRKVFVILDGLEPGFGQQHKGDLSIGDLLVTLSMLRSRNYFNVLITSRTQDGAFVSHCCHPSRASPRNRENVRGEILARVHRDDIAQFARQEIRTDRKDVGTMVSRLEACKKHPQNTQQSIKDAIWESCAGVFLVAQLNSLELRFNRKRAVRRILTGSEVKQPVGKGYTKQLAALDGAYSRLVNQMCDKFHDGLKFVRLAFEVLMDGKHDDVGVKELEDLWVKRVGNNKDLSQMEDALLSGGCGLLEFCLDDNGTDDHRVRLVHHTFYEFLLRHREMAEGRLGLHDLPWVGADG